MCQRIRSSIRYALDRLAKAHLLESSPAPAKYSRRDFIARLKKLGLAASVALPVVSSIVSPTPAHAMSCVLAGNCGVAGDCTPCYQGNPAQCGTENELQRILPADGASPEHLWLLRAAN